MSCFTINLDIRVNALNMPIDRTSSTSSIESKSSPIPIEPPNRVRTEEETQINPTTGVLFTAVPHTNRQGPIPLIGPSSKSIASTPDAPIDDRMKRAGLTDPEKTVPATKAWIETEGRNPVATLGHLMSPDGGTQVLLIGEKHTNNLHRKAMVEYVKALAANGATHLAVEMSPEEQAGLDYFLSTGDDSKITHQPTHQSYLPILKAAREAGLLIVAVDNSRTSLGNYGVRDMHMAEEIRRIVKENPEAKVVAFLGAEHVGTAYRPDEGLNRTTVTDYLRMFQEKLPNSGGLKGRIVTVNPSIGNMIPHQVVRVSEPTILPTANSPIADLRFVPPGEDGDPLKVKGTDYIILYPK